MLKATLRELISEVKLKLGDILFHSLFIFLEAAKIFIVRETGKHVEVDNVQHYNKLKSKEQSRHQVPDLNCVTSRIVKIVEFVFKKTLRNLEEGPVSEEAVRHSQGPQQERVN